VRNWSIVFAIHVTGDILAIYVNEIGVVNIAAGFVVAAVLLSFTWNVSFAISVSTTSVLTITAVTLVALVALVVVSGVGVSGHF
jgi:hypothetical protein